MSVKEILEQTGALLKGHFLLSSGKHSEYYVQCARLFEDPKIGDFIGGILAEKIKSYGVQAVVGPALGGVLLAYAVSKALGVRNMFAEREGGLMRFRRGFKVGKGERVAVVEDVVTTGKSVKEVIEVVKSMGGEVVAVGSIVNRSGRENPFDLPYVYLEKIDFPVYEPEECPLCKKGVPLEKPGSRYLKSSV